MTILVTGATGSIGGAVTAALLDQGAAVRALVRGPDRAAKLPLGVQAVLGDLLEPASVEAALTGVDAALYISPHDPDEVRMAEIFVQTCDRLGVRLVFAGVYAAESNAAARWFVRSLIGLAMPHYRGKFHIGHLMSRARNRPIVFGLTNYYQNDELIREHILAGNYVLPTHHRGVNRVDLRDVAEVVARALTDPEFPSGGYTLAGPESISGMRAADTWWRALGRPVRYGGTNVDLAAVLGGRLSGQKLSDFQHSYRFLARFGFATSQKDVAATTRLLGRAPRTYTSYVRDTAERWRQELAGVDNQPVTEATARSVRSSAVSRGTELPSQPST